MSLLKKIIDLVLYGNFWIATGAMCLCLETQLLLTGQLHLSSFVLFVFAATHFIYAIHRLVGMEKVKAFKNQGRFKVIVTFQKHIRIYAFLSFLAMAYLFWFIPFRWSLVMWVPGILSLAYVLPVLGRKRRLRDLNFIKIFLIASVWPWITVVLPAVELGMETNVFMMLMAVERGLFIFSLTIPFDIRDMTVDDHTGVKTLPSRLGREKVKMLGWICLVGTLAIGSLLWKVDAYSSGTWLALQITYLTTAGLIYFSDKVHHDYYFSGLTDGMMHLQFLLVLLLH